MIAHRVTLGREVDDIDLAILGSWRSQPTAAAAWLLERWLEPSVLRHEVLTWPQTRRDALTGDVLTVLIGRDPRFARAAEALTGHAAGSVRVIDRRRVAVHEAGHAIVADEFGLLREISVHGDADAAGVTIADTLATHLARLPWRLMPRSLALSLEGFKFVALAVAGELAEELLLGGVDEPTAGARDREKARGLAHLGAAGGVNINHYLETQRRLAAEILARRRSHLERLVTALQQRGRLTAANVRELWRA